MEMEQESTNILLAQSDLPLVEGKKTASMKPNNQR
jgi:hypothetical protein